MRISFIFALFAFLAISSVAFAEDETTTANPVVVETTTAPPSGEETTLAPSESTTAAPSGEETTVAPSGEETTTAAPSESTTAAPSGEETTLAPSESTTAAPSGEETTTAAPSETTTAAPSSETTAAPSGEETTLAPSESTTAAPSGEETTAAPSGEETTAAPSGEETTVAPSGEETAAPTTVAPTTVAPTTNAPTTDAPTTQAPFQSFGPNGQETKGSFQISSDSEVTKESVGEAIADTLKINETRVRVDSVTASRKRATSYQIDFAILEDASSGVSSVVLLKELQTTLSDGTALGSVGTVSGFKVVSVNYAAEYSTFGQTTATRANIQSGSVAMTFAVATSVALFALAL